MRWCESVCECMCSLIIQNYSTDWVNFWHGKVLCICSIIVIFLFKDGVHYTDGPLQFTEWFKLFIQTYKQHVRSNQINKSTALLAERALNIEGNANWFAVFSNTVIVY